MIIVFAGTLGRFPVGGHAWINLQYMLGFRDLGHEVYYLEECGDGCWVYRWETGDTADDLAYSATYLRGCLRSWGFAKRWTLRSGDHILGMPLKAFRDICAKADLLLIRGSPLRRWRPEYDLPRHRAYLDVDPGFTQASLLAGDPWLSDTVARCERLFTLAQRIGAADCRIVATGRHWLATVSPVWLPAWPFVCDGSATCFTTVMQWRSFDRSHAFSKLTDDSALYGQKDEAFANYIDLPRRTDQRLRLALTGGPPDDLAAHGWELTTGWAATRTPARYRAFVQRSRAEFSLAKRRYVLSQGGWFSDRSACYLASGRPVITEDTGFPDWLPAGEGLLAFRTPDEAFQGIEAINADYDRHRRAARQLAERHFAADRVLPALLEQATD
jgi:hypothetical protein